ncbi:MAG TPA: 2Fe-2S iron-sulfur cluster binding domain-containing protein [Cellvibrionaceae bacterium]
MSTANIHFNQQIIASDGQSVLTALLKRGHAIPYSCQSGVCHSCLMICDKGTLPTTATAGLSTEQRRQGLFLSCSCIPGEDLWVSRYDLDAIKIPAKVIDKQLLNNEVMALILKADVSFRAGQFMTLWRDATTARCYSLARPFNSDHLLEFHLRLWPNGAFSHWARHSLKPGDHLALQGPEGDSYYRDDDPTMPLLLAATGTGLAPVYAIAREALARGHTGPIHLIIGSRDPKHFYYLAELQALGREPRVHIHLLAQALDQGDTAPPMVVAADIYAFVRNQFSELRDYQIHLAGAESFVQKMRKVCFMAGASPRQVYADAFTRGH